MIDINNISPPDIVEELSYENLKEDILAHVKKYVKDYEFLESDRFAPLIEALAYRELILRARINTSIKATLLPSATGSDLDNVISMYGIYRLKGSKPTANMTFNLSVPIDKDVKLTKGLVFTNSSGTSFSTLEEEVVIKAGKDSVAGVLRLDEYVKESDVVTDIFTTPLPYVIRPVQTSRFVGGADKEDDEAFRVRALHSFERFSTAGSAQSYIYHALSATPQVIGVHADSPTPGKVRIVLLIKGDENEAVKAVKEVLTDEKVRPLTDTVIVEAAKRVEAEVKAELELFNNINANEIVKEAIEELKNKSWSLGEDLNLSYIYRSLHRDGVYRVRLLSPTQDVTVSPDEYISLNISVDSAEMIP